MSYILVGSGYSMLVMPIVHGCKVAELEEYTA